MKKSLLSGPDSHSGCAPEALLTTNWTPPPLLNTPARGTCSTAAHAAPPGVDSPACWGAYLPSGVCQALPTATKSVRDSQLWFYHCSAALLHA